MNRQRRSNEEKLVLRLYMAGDAPHSTEARANLKAILKTYAPLNNWQLEVVDVLETPLRALEDSIFVTPTLIKLSPPPTRIIGSLSERENVARLLGLEDT